MKNGLDLYFDILDAKNSCFYLQNLIFSMPIIALTAIEITDYYVCVKICCAGCQVSANAFLQEIVPKWWSRGVWECKKSLVASLGLKSDKSSIIE